MKKILLLLTVFQFTALCGKVDTVLIPSAVMQKEYKAVIVFPESYYTDQKNTLPVVYLLHGWSGKYSDWINKTDLASLADKYQLIIVCPDGGFAGWYLNSPIKKDSQYETYIGQEVIRFIDNKFRTIKDTKGRFICGLSMGGQGALRLLIKFPDVFAAAGSMSGVMDLNESTKKFGITELLGDFSWHSKRWQNNSVINLVEKLAGKNKGIIIDCGIKDRFIEGNRKLHQKMLDLNINHDYYERPGGHSWEYWVNALEYHLLFFKKRLLMN